MSAAGDQAVGMAFAVAAGIDAAYAGHICNAPAACAICILKIETDAAWRRWQNRHPEAAAAVKVNREFIEAAEQLEPDAPDPAERT